MNGYRKFIPRFTYPNVVATAVILFAVPWLFWAIVDRKPVAASVSEVISNQVPQGDFLQIDYDVVWASRCEIIAFRCIIDEMQVEWPISAQQRVVEEGPQRFTLRIPVPMAAAPGKALYRGTLRYQCNPWQRFFPLEQELMPRTFTIVENADLVWRKRRLQGVFEGPPIMRRFAGFSD